MVTVVVKAMLEFIYKGCLLDVDLYSYSDCTLALGSIFKKIGRPAP